MSSGVACDDPAQSPGQSSVTDQIGLLSASWDAHAQEWIDWVRAPDCQDSYLRFHRERFMSLVPSPGRLTVDIGCGEGRVARDLQASGHKVLGVDLSHTMCRAAATYVSTPAPAVCADAGKLPLADGSADCAIAFMSLQDIDNMPGAVNEIARVLKDDCSLALAIVHPLYSGGGFAGTSAEPDRFIINRSYFKAKRLVSTDEHKSHKVTFFREHRPLEAYTQALTKAGFSINELHELTDEDKERKRDGIPVFLDILATRRRREKGSMARFKNAWLLPVVSGLSGIAVGALLLLVSLHLY